MVAENRRLIRIALAGGFIAAFVCGGGLDVIRLAARPSLWLVVLSPEIAAVMGIAGACIAGVAARVLGLHRAPLWASIVILIPATFAFTGFAWMLGDDGDLVPGLRAVANELDRSGIAGWRVERAHADSGDGCAEITASDGIPRCCAFSGAYRGSKRVNIDCYACASGCDSEWQQRPLTTLGH